MTQPPPPPGPDEPAGPPEPPVRPPFPGPDMSAPAVYDPGYQQLPPGGFEPPTGYDPEYPVASTAPVAGYGVPIFGQQAGYDPLISPDYSGWWRRTTALLKTAWRPLAILQAIGFVVALLFAVPQALYLVYLSDALPRTNADGTFTDSTAGQSIDFQPFFGIFGIMFLGVFVTYLVKFAVAIASNHVGVSVASGLQPRVGASLAMAARRVFPLLGWQLLAFLMIVVGICACVLPAIYLLAVFIILPAVVTFERGTAISRCFALFHRDLGASVSRIATILGLVVGVGVLAAIIAQIVQLAIGGAGPDLSSDGPLFSTSMVVGLVASTVVAGLLNAGGAVVTASLTLTAYADMRARVEPLSTAMLAGELGLAPVGAPEWGAPAV